MCDLHRNMTMSDADKLKEAQFRKVAELQPWLNLIELPGAA